ncbi:uncharacterized protein PHACADRAFT_189353 [Phanerochaete carnosa HHB-10118-sp]|uniref:Uncharacterized protein n=1 Tax=Phanerochaete carnosa (strain HHB-10118-sp) TaxID=650164 RepID=K5VBE4_PHACS|nr:uncharacterized protein PHACADRAFT_189353 [Phanerochaete carnosa HHB-10118-sp]EKM60221.1 hypothetical protein PHACADRAFT_189353 [Phanerochaete carnosa HHB-10118-sp]
MHCLPTGEVRTTIAQGDPDEFSAGRKRYYGNSWRWAEKCSHEQVDQRTESPSIHAQPKPMLSMAKPSVPYEDSRAEGARSKILCSISDDEYLDARPHNLFATISALLKLPVSSTTHLGGHLRKWNLDSHVPPLRLISVVWHFAGISETRISSACWRIKLLGVVVGYHHIELSLLLRSSPYVQSLLVMCGPGLKASKPAKPGPKSLARVKPGSGLKAGLGA